MGSEYPADLDRRKQSQIKLQALVQTRTETLSLLADLANRRPFTPDPAIEDTLRRFCQALMDYAASAHFQLYRYIADNRERRQAVIAVAEKLYPHIVETTDAILRFNDKYESMSLDNSVEFLDVDLSSLGETLAERIQLEDQVIRAMGGTVQ
jgi:regulator of sigma D